MNPAVINSKNIGHERAAFIPIFYLQQSILCLMNGSNRLGKNLARADTWLLQDDA